MYPHRQTPAEETDMHPFIHRARDTAITQVHPISFTDLSLNHDSPKCRKKAHIPHRKQNEKTSTRTPLIPQVNYLYENAAKRCIYRRAADE